RNCWPSAQTTDQSANGLIADTFGAMADFQTSGQSPYSTGRARRWFSTAARAMLRNLTRAERAPTLKKQMKKTLVTALCVLAICSASVTPCRADTDKQLKIITDVAVLRPGGLIATAVGSVFFVVSLPFSAATHTIKET